MGFLDWDRLSLIDQLIWMGKIKGGGGILKTVKAALVHITDALAKPAVSVKAYVEPVQSGSGDPSPENVRAITGFTGANVYVTNKNILGGTLLKDAVKDAMPSATVDTTNKTVSFAANTSTNGSITKQIGFEKKFKENTPYTFIMTLSASAKSPNLRIAYTDGTFANLPNASTANAKETIRFVSNSSKTVQYFGKVNQQGSTTLYYDESGVFEGSITADDFEAYQGNVYNITFPSSAGTVYGGEVDVTGGKLRVTDANIVSYNGETLPSTWLSSMDVYASGTTPTTGAQVVYKLATPIEYDLTPQQIQMLLGENNLWNDCNGDTEVTYYADGTASTTEALNLLLGGRYVNNQTSEDVPDREALQIILGETR